MAAREILRTLGRHRSPGQHGRGECTDQDKLDARTLVERATRWLLRYRRPPLDIGATISHFSEGATELSERIPEILLDGDREA